MREESAEDHLAAFVHQLVERLDVRQFEAEDSDQGRWLSTGVAVEGVVVRLRVEGDVLAAVGTAHPAGPELPLFSRLVAAGSLDFKRFSAVASARPQ